MRCWPFCLDSGELACGHRRSFARQRTISALEHAPALRELRGAPPEPELEQPPLARYEALIPACAQAELAQLFRTLKAPAAARALAKLAERARAEEWRSERCAEALLATEVASRDAQGGEARLKQARFPARTTLEEFDFSFQRSLQKDARLAPGPARRPERQRQPRPFGPARDRQDPL